MLKNLFLFVVQLSSLAIQNNLNNLMFKERDCFEIGHFFKLILK
jgi:hypothetical protein